MEKNLSQLFKEDTSVPAELADRVFQHIQKRMLARDRQQGYFWGTFFVFSLGAFISSAVYAYDAFKASNFGSYFSLIFSDTGSIAHWWKQLGLSLIESLPLLGVITLLASISVLLWSLRKFAKHTGNFSFTTSARTA